MAKYDHGGGCPCGLQRECNCDTSPLPKKQVAPNPLLKLGQAATQTLRETAGKAPRLTTDPKSRKDTPIARGVLDYFPDALCEVANLSRIGNEQHNPGQPMHWARGKSTDHADCILRHLIDRGTMDTDGVRHATKVAWRALALLQTEIELEREANRE